jgi:glutamate 5-kinase
VGEGKSLLPIGMTAVEGDFSRGDVIAVRDARGAEVARGPGQLRERRGAAAVPQVVGDFERLLGYVAEPEMIHRDNLVLGRT